MEDELNIKVQQKVPNYTWGDRSYSSIDEKANLWNDEGRGKLSYHGIITTDGEFDAFYKTMVQREKIIYRGINNAKYKIFTSLQVHYLLNKYINVSPQEYITNEISSLKKAHKGLFPRYFQSIGVDETDFLYLSLMQHYRAKTPFLDFSRSLDSALFFAYDAYDKSFCNNLQNPNNYVSVFWIDLNEKAFEFVDIIQLLSNSIESALRHIGEFLSKYPNTPLDTSNIAWENYLMWYNPQNKDGGFSAFDMGIILDHNIPLPRRFSAQEYNKALVDFKNAAKRGLLTPQLLDQYIQLLSSIIMQNSRLTNLNIIAQDGCFVLYNPKEPFVPMEEYWAKCPTYVYLPKLHCVDIHKDLIPTSILPLLTKNGISSDTIYPIEKDIVSAIVTK